MGNKEQIYSIDGSHYMYWENLMHELRESYNDGEEVEVWEADEKEYKHSDFLDVNVLINDMQCNASDQAGEVTEEYLNDLTEQKKEDLKKHISNWFYVNAKLSFYGVENPKKIVVIVE